MVVDDDVRICKLLNHYLAREGYKVSTAANGEQMRRVFDHDVPDLVILDLMLPDEDGFTLAKELRTWSDVGIIMLTGKTAQVDKIVGLEIGADDYLTKPFDTRELLARVRSVLRRVSQFSRPRYEKNHPVAHFAGWTLNLSAHELISPIGDHVDLTNYEFHLLSALVLNANLVLINVLYLPTYSHDCNRDGKGWNNLKNKELKGHQAKTKKEIKKLARKKLSKLSIDLERMRGIYFRCCIAELLE